MVCRCPKAEYWPVALQHQPQVQWTVQQSQVSNYQNQYQIVLFQSTLHPICLFSTILTETIWMPSLPRTSPNEALQFLSCRLLTRDGSRKLISNSIVITEFLNTLASETLQLKLITIKVCLPFICFAFTAKPALLNRQLLSKTGSQT